MGARWSFGLSPAGRAVLTWGLGAGGPSRFEPPGPLDPDGWARLREEVARHRLGGLLVAAVAGGGVLVSPDQAAEAAHLEVDLTLARVWQESRFGAIVDDLERSGIEVRVLKGPGIAALDYPDPQLRPTRDLDVLVRARDLPAAVAVLTDRGGTRTDPDPTPGYADTVGKGATVALADGLEVDLHRTLVWGPFGVRIVVADLWDRARPFDHGGRRLLALDRETSLLHACYHLLVLGFRRALSGRDVVQLLRQPGLDVDRVLWLARRWDGEAVLAAGVTQALDQLGLTDDGELAAWARGFVPRLRDRVWLRVEQPEGGLGPLEPAATYAALRTPVERAVLRRATVRPDPGTWPSPADRLRRVGQRLGRAAAPDRAPTA